MAAEEEVFHGARVKRRHPFGPLGLSIITLGIYTFYWWYQVNREMRDLGEEVDPARSVLAVSLGWLLIVPPFVSIYRTAGRIQRVRSRLRAHASGVTEGEMIPGLAVVLFVLPLINVLFHAYFQTSLNDLYAQPAGATTTTATYFPAGTAIEGQTVTE